MYDYYYTAIIMCNFILFYHWVQFMSSSGAPISAKQNRELFIYARMNNVDDRYLSSRVRLLVIIPIKQQPSSAEADQGDVPDC